MQEVLIFEIIVILIMIGFAAVGWNQGLVKTLFQIMRKLIILILAFVFWYVISRWMPRDMGLAPGFVFLFAFVISGILLHFIIRMLGIVDQIPIVREINKLAGIIAGLINGLVHIWIFFTALILFKVTVVGETLLRFISDSSFLELIYQSNPLISLVNKLVQLLGL